MEGPNRSMSMLALLVMVSAVLSVVKAGSAGDSHSCAVFDDGSVKVKLDAINIFVFTRG